MYKRTNYPSTTSMLVTWEPINVYGELQQVPRRKKFTMPAEGSANYANQVKRLEDMQKNRTSVVWTASSAVSGGTKNKPKTNFSI